MTALRRRRSACFLASALLTLAYACRAFAACPSEPKPLCRVGGSAKLDVRHFSDDEQDRLSWIWSRGESTIQSDLGDPLATTTYSLCAWDASGHVMEIEIPPGGDCDGKPCWAVESPAGFRYSGARQARDGIRSIRLAGSSRARAKIRVDGRGSALPDLTSALVPPVTVQLVRDDSSICFESIFDSAAFTTNNAEVHAARSRFDALQPVPALPSPGCGEPIARWNAGTSTPDSLVHDSLTRTFRVYVPSLYDAAVPSPVVILLHGGFGSGAQIETSSRMLEVADEHGFIVVSPDGVTSPAGIRTWNAGGCCGYAASADIDDVGFVRDLLDRLAENACVDRRRVYAAGMSNGAELSHRLACDLGDRIRAIGPVAGVDVTAACTPARAVPMLQVHGTADQNVPYDGGFGCGLSGVSTPSVPDTVALRAARNSCTGEPVTSLVLGDGRCTRQGKCPNGNDVELCVIGGGGHHWPGGVPPSISGIGNCSFGYQSQTFSAPRVLWNFFSAHPSGGALASLENLVTGRIEPQLRRTR